MDSLPRIIGAPGRAGSLGAKGQEITSRLTLDFENAPDSDYMEVLSQLDPVIGMRAVDALEYAPHTLPSVFPVPYQSFEHTRTFNTNSWTYNGTTPSRMTPLDGRWWKYTEGTGSSDIAQRITGGKGVGNGARNLGDPWTISWRVPKGGSNNVRYVRISQWTLANFCSAIFDLEEEDFGTIQEPAGCVTTPGFIDYGDEWEIYVTVLNDDPNEVPFASLHTCVSPTDPTRVTGGEFLLAEPKSYPGARRDVPFIKTDELAALSGWALSGTNQQFTVVWDSDEETFCYELVGLDTAAPHWVQPVGRRASTAVPHTMGIRSRLVEGEDYLMACAVAGPWTVFSNTGWADVETTLTPAVVPCELPQIGLSNKVGRLRFYMIDAAEGQELFGPNPAGLERYFVRKKQGIGGLWEPDGIQNECQNNSIAPVDLTGITDGTGVTTTVVQRDDLPAGIRAALDAGPYRNVRAMYRSQGSGTVYVTGATGDTDERFVRALVWAETGTAGAVLGLEDNGFAPVSGTGVLDWAGGKGTPLAATDRFSLAVVTGDVYWIANMMHAGNRARSHIPVAEANRVKSADRPVAATDDVGMDRTRNGAPNSSNNGAALGPLSTTGSLPTGWIFNETNGWLCEVVEIGDGHIDFRLTGTITGATQFDLTGNTVIDADNGQVWQGPASLSVSNTDNVTALNVALVERDGGGTYVTETGLSVLNVISDTLRRFNVSRTITTANGKVQGRIQLNGSGAVDFLLRIEDWSAQQSAELLPHVETTGTAIEFQQWDTGFTVEDVWDIADASVDNARFWTMYGDDGTNQRIDLRSSGGVDVVKGALAIVKDGSQSATSTLDSFIGEHLHSSRLKQNDNEYRMDGNVQGALLVELPSDVHTLMLGNYPGLSLSRDGICKNITFIGERKTGA